MDRDYGPGSYGGMDRDYGHGSYGGQRSMDSYLNQSYGMDNHSGGGGGSRFGPYESYDSRSSLGGRDLYRSGYGFNEPEQSRFGGSYGGRFESSYRNSLDSFGGRNQGGSSWEAPYSRSKLRPGFMEDRGRENYSSYSSFSSPHMKPAPVGSRGEERLLILKVRLEAETMMLLEDHQQAEAEAEDIWVILETFIDPELLLTIKTNPPM